MFSSYWKRYFFILFSFIKIYDSLYQVSFNSEFKNCIDFDDFLCKFYAYFVFNIITEVKVLLIHLLIDLKSRHIDLLINYEMRVFLLEVKILTR